jgi:molecular chaperone IbpA
MASGYNYTVQFPNITTSLISGGIGWNHQFSQLQDMLSESDTKYPPHNIIQGKNEDAYVIELAVAGFAKEDLEIKVKDGVLRVSGITKETVLDEYKYIHHGIKKKDFDKHFSLAEHVEVVNASYEDGLLRIELERQVPKELQPKTIKIK